jgi:hypothetical protein
MRPLLVGAILFGCCLPSTALQPKPPEKKDLPSVVVAVPLGVPAGKETKLVLRGLRLDTATKVELAEGGGEVKILRKGKVGVPNQGKVEQYGDTEIEVQLTPPEGKERFGLVVLTPAGTSAAHAILVDDASVIAEKEPNNGYRTAQEVKLGQTVAGTIAANQDVDCFKFTGEVGQVIVVEVLASRLGSPLDPFLTLTDEAGQILAQADDLPGSRDARIEVQLPRKGTYFVTLQDAHDVGSALHGYRLQVRVK